MTHTHSHTHVNALMSRDLDGRLRANETMELEQGLAECVSCRRDLARMRLVASVLRESDPMAHISVPLDLEARVRRQVAAYEISQAVAREAKAQRRAVQRQAHAAFWRGPGWRLVIVVMALTLAGAIWRQTYPENGIVGAVTHFWMTAAQLLTIPGPEEIAWSVWIGAAALALAVGYWFARADASAAWRRELVERLPQLW